MSDLTYIVPAEIPRAFRPGDQVEVMDREMKVLSTQRVIQAGTKSVITSCGRTWDQRGWYVGDAGACPFPSIRLAKEVGK